MEKRAQQTEKKEQSALLERVERESARKPQSAVNAFLAAQQDAAGLSKLPAKTVSLIAHEIGNSAAAELFSRRAGIETALQAPIAGERSSAENAIKTARIPLADASGIAAPGETQAYANPVNAIAQMGGGTDGTDVGG